jgi:hypothetical protein
VVEIPEETWMSFDTQRGVETLWLVFAADSLPELEQLRQFANKKTRGLITDLERNRALKKFLESNASPKVSVDKGETLTTLKTPEKLLVYPIRFQHH